MRVASSRAPSPVSTESPVFAVPPRNEVLRRRPLALRLLWLVVGFAVLDVYLNIPHVVGGPPVGWWGLYAGFFPLAHGVGRLSGVGGLGEMGLARHQGWVRNLLLGFVFCAALWTLKYVLLWALGAFRVEGVRPAGEVTVLVGQALGVLLLSCAADDVLLRGYLFRQLSGHLSAGALVTLSTFLSIVNHAWSMQLTLEGSVVLGLLGLMFALALVRTGSLWLGIGLHWGGSVLYRLHEGFDAEGGVLRRVVLTEAPWHEGVGFGVAALAFAALVPLFRFTARSGQEGPLVARG